MRNTLLLSFALLSASASLAQTGFSTKSYPAVLPATTSNFYLLSADLNGDGRPDLFSYGGGSGNVFLNNGSGGFLAPATLPGALPLAAAQIGDMNGDGYPDIVGCTNVGTGTANQAITVTVFLNQGNGTFKTQPAVAGSGQCASLTLGDVNHTGALDVVTVGSIPGQYNPGGTYFPGITAVFDIFTNPGDGILAVSSETQGNVFDDPKTSSNYTNCAPINVVGADFEQNGNFDLVVSSQCFPSNAMNPGNVGTTFYLPETVNGTAANGYQYNTYNHVSSQFNAYANGKLADLNGDGKLDIVYAGNLNGTTGNVVSLINTGGGSFTTNSNLQGKGATAVAGAAVADFNADGQADIAFSYNVDPQGSAPPAIEILNGSASGAFTDSQDFSTTTSTVSAAADIATADFNGDGKPDLAVLAYDMNAQTTTLTIYTNTQAGTSQGCSAPTAVNTNIICVPTSGDTVNSPVTVTAASNVPGFTLNRLYLDNVSVYQAATQTINTAITAAAGTHTLVLVSYSSTGKAYTYSRNFTVGAAAPSGGCLPASSGLMICSPTSLSTEGSPVQFSAGAIAKAGNLTAIRAYIDYNSLFTSSNPAATKTYDFVQTVAVPVGQHLLVMVGYDSTGGSVTNSLNFVVTGTCTAPTGGTSIKICSPSTLGGTQNSPFAVTAGAYTATGYIAAIRIYIDNVAVATYGNPGTTKAFSINQAVSSTSGSHNLVVVAYPSTGGAVTSSETIVVY